MAKNSVSDWSEVAAENIDIGGLELRENLMLPSGVNNAFRTLMAQVATALGDGTIVGGTAIEAFDNVDTKGADIASASSIDLTTATGARVNITGTTTIGTVTLAEGAVRIARAVGAFTLTASASLIVNSSETNSYTTTAGDLLMFEGYASSVVRVWLISSPSNENIKWLSKAIGELYAVDDTMTGADTPPTDNALYRFIKLTAGEDGTGEYNEGILTGESVTGSAPLVVATATISLAGSPINGQTINLINTERRFLRAGAAGTVENDQFQSHVHDQQINGTGTQGQNGSINFTYSPVIFSTGVPETDGANGTPRIGNETRPKNIGMTYYMRIL